MKYALQFKKGFYGKVWWTCEITDDPLKAIEFCTPLENFKGEYYIFNNILLSEMKDGDKVYSSRGKRYNPHFEYTLRILAVSDPSKHKLKFSDFTNWI